MIQKACQYSGSGVRTTRDPHRSGEYEPQCWKSQNSNSKYQWSKKCVDTLVLEFGQPMLYIPWVNLRLKTEFQCQPPFITPNENVKFRCRWLILNHGSNLSQPASPSRVARLGWRQ